MDHAHCIVPGVFLHTAVYLSLVLTLSAGAYPVGCCRCLCLVSEAGASFVLSNIPVEKGISRIYVQNILVFVTGTD